MIVKVGNQIFDSDKEIVTVKLTPGEKDFIAHMPTKDDLVSIYPNGMEADDVVAFNKVFEMARKKLEDPPKPTSQKELPLSDPIVQQMREGKVTKPKPPLKMPVPASKDVVDVASKEVPAVPKKTVKKKTRTAKSNKIEY